MYIYKQSSGSSGEGLNIVVVGTFDNLRHAWETFLNKKIFKNL